MKTEIETANENILNKDGKVSEQHLSTCKRFLEYLEKDYRYLQGLGVTHLEMRNTIENLQKAIEIYNGNGIKSHSFEEKK